MSKHTPGKWEIGREVKTAINAGTKHIAMVNFYKCGDPKVDVYGAEHEANARLIAAAPQLLEALREIVKSGVYPDCPACEIMYEIADNVIDAATTDG